MGLLEKAAPRFEGSLDLPGEGRAFLDHLVAEGFSPTGLTGSRSHYEARIHGEGVLVEAADGLTAWNIGLEWVALLVDPLSGGRFRLLYEVRFPRWARFCWTISLCTTLVPVVVISAVALLLGGIFPSARPATLEAMSTWFYLLLVTPFVLFGLALPPFLVVVHRPRARMVLERVLKERAEAVAAENRPPTG